MIFKKLSSNKAQDWFIFVGLGNPGREYENTRHNIGFLVIQRLAERWGINVTRYKFNSLSGDGMAKDKRVALVMPQTYMNKSGFAVGSFAKFYKLDMSHMMIIHDDLDLPFGRIRLRKSGGSAGQKGMQSIINQLGHSEFPRLRVGIGRPPGRMDPVDYVLKKFKPKDEILLGQVLDACTDAIEMYLEEGIEKAMTKFNQSILDDEE